MQLQKDPNLADARYLLGQSYSMQGQYADALNQFERALDLGMDHDELMAGLLGSRVRLGRYQEVLGALESRQPLSPSLALVLGDAYLATEQIDKASAIYDQHADLAAANRELGTIAWLQREPTEANRLLERAVAIDPADRESWLRKGEFALSAGDLPSVLLVYSVPAEANMTSSSACPGGNSSG